MSRRGAIRLRSNVILETEGKEARDRAWTHVPGDIVRDYLSRGFGGRRQVEERMYGEPCSRCGRLIHQIARDGCNEAWCAKPDPEAVERVKDIHARALKEIEQERVAIATGEQETIRLRPQEDEPPGEILDTDAAVERLLGGDQAKTTVDSHGEDPASVAEPAQAALADALRQAGSVEVDGRGYVPRPIDAFVDTLTLGQARRALKMLGDGRSAELERRESLPPMICAAHSSTALAVNSLAPWLDALGWLRIGPYSGFTEIRFGGDLPTPLRDASPDLDAYLDGRHVAIALVSQCTEHLITKPAAFHEGNAGQVAQLAHASWAEELERLQADPGRYSYLDAVQLIRHYLDVRAVLGSGDGPQVIGLVYAYWEPAAADASQVVQDHRDEMARFSKSVADPEVPFLALSWPGLWNSWNEPGGPAWIADHVRGLRQRYVVDAVSARSS